MYDEERNIEGAKPCIYAINATQKLNSDIALDFRRVLEQNLIEFLIPYDIAKEEILSQNNDYIGAPDGETQIFYERPFLETQVLINECVELTYEKRDTGVIVLRENSNAHKDHYSACSYSSWFSTLLEKDLFSDLQEYEVGVFVD